MGGAPTRHRGRSRYPTRSRNAGATGAAPATFNPLTGFTTNPIHAVWASDPLWTPPADGGAVSSWRNGGSVGTPNLTQATGSKQPTYRASTAAYNNQPTVQGDGTDDFIDAAFTVVAQPAFHVVVGNLSATTSTLHDGTDGTNRHLVDGTGGWRIFAGTVVAAGTVNTNPHLFRTKLSGASSSLFIDEASVLSGNAGAGGTDSIRLFANLTGVATNGGHIAYWALFDTDPTALPEWATFKAWVTSTYGITVA